MNAEETANILVTRTLNNFPTAFTYKELPDDPEELKEIVEQLLAITAAAITLYAPTRGVTPRQLWTNWCLMREMQRLKL